MAAAAEAMAKIAALQVEAVQNVASSMARIESLLQEHGEAPAATAAGAEDPELSTPPEAAPRRSNHPADAGHGLRAPSPVAAGRAGPNFDLARGLDLRGAAPPPPGREAPQGDAEVRYWQERIAELSKPVVAAPAEVPPADDEVDFWRRKIALLSRPVPGSRAAAQEQAQAPGSGPGPELELAAPQPRAASLLRRADAAAPPLQWTSRSSYDEGSGPGAGESKRGGRGPAMWRGEGRGGGDGGKEGGR